MSNTIYCIPIEPLEERYTEQWYRNIPAELTQRGHNVINIDGVALTSTVEVGAFLDMNSTVAYKCSQMAKIAQLFHERKVEDGSIFFVYDLEFWGIEALRLMADMNGVKIEIYGFLHAASYTKEDAFSIAAPYQKYTELGWLKACDKVFVGSHYHKRAVMDRRVFAYATEADAVEIAKKIIVTGNPLFVDEYQPRPDFSQKKRQVVISNRFDWEKRPNMSLDFAYLLKKRNPDVNIVVCTGRQEFRSNRNWLVEKARAMEADGILEIRAGLTKQEYHQILNESMVMLTNSIEESYGYCMVEAQFYGCHSIAPAICSHVELASITYQDEDEIIALAEDVLNSTYNPADSEALHQDVVDLADRTAINLFGQF